MTRLIALLVALAFALGAGTTPAWAQAPKEPAKPEQKAPPAAKKEPLGLADSASLVAAFRQGLRALGDAEGRPFPPSSCDTRMGVPNVPDLAANWSGPKLTSSSRRALDTPETRSDRDLRLILRRNEPVARAIAPGFLPEVRFRLRR